MKVIKILLVTFSILVLCVGCTHKKNDDFKGYLEKNFSCKSIQKAKLTVPPILGGNFNYYATFKDKSDNDCFIIADSNMNKYILIYDNCIIEENKEVITTKYKDLINTLLNPVNLETSYTINSTLTNAKIKKVKSNLKMFKSGEIGELDIDTKRIYKDEKDSDRIGSSHIHTVVIFDTQTKQYYQFSELIK